MSDQRIEACRTVRCGSFVRLRPLSVHDAEATLRWRLGARASLLNSGATTIEGQRDWISNRSAVELNFVIERYPNTPVGMLSLVDIDLAAGRAEPARFLIGEEGKARGAPVAVEAMKLLYGLAFDELRLTELQGFVVKENRRMLKWQLYLGMREDGVVHDPEIVNGKLREMVGVRMTVEDYRCVSLPRLNRLIAMTGSPPNDKEKT